VNGDNHRSHVSIEVYIGAATLILSTAGILLGSPKLAIVALAVGGVSVGLALGSRRRD
jgi:hypothetical protein